MWLPAAGARGFGACSFIYCLSCDGTDCTTYVYFLIMCGVIILYSLSPVAFILSLPCVILVSLLRHFPGQILEVILGLGWLGLAPFPSRLWVSAKWQYSCSLLVYSLVSEYTHSRPQSQPSHLHFRISHLNLYAHSSSDIGIWTLCAWYVCQYTLTCMSLLFILLRTWCSVNETVTCNATGNLTSLTVASTPLTHTLDFLVENMPAWWMEQWPPLQINFMELHDY